MAPISTGELESTYELWSHPQCSGSTRDVGSLVDAGTHLPCGYMEQLVRLSSCGHTPSWSSVQDPRVTFSHWLAQVVHIYPVATGTAHNNFYIVFAYVYK